MNGVEALQIDTGDDETDDTDDRDDPSGDVSLNRHRDLQKRKIGKMDQSPFQAITPRPWAFGSPTFWLVRSQRDYFTQSHCRCGNQREPARRLGHMARR